MRQNQRIHAARNRNQNPVAVCQHGVVVQGPTHQPVDAGRQAQDRAYFR